MMKNKIFLSAILLIGLSLTACVQQEPPREASDTQEAKALEERNILEETSEPRSNSNIYTALGKEENLQTIYFAGGCFWGVEEYFSRIDGVHDVVSGYANGNTENPSYEDVIYRQTGHAETVKVTYDETQISLEQLIGYYYKIIDPTSVNRQGNDVGNQYRTGIYYSREDDMPIIEKLQNLEQKNIHNLS